MTNPNPSYKEYLWPQLCVWFWCCHSILINCHKWSRAEFEKKKILICAATSDGTFWLLVPRLKVKTILVVMPLMHLFSFVSSCLDSARIHLRRPFRGAKNFSGLTFSFIEPEYISVLQFFSWSCYVLACLNYCMADWLMVGNLFISHVSKKKKKLDNRAFFEVPRVSHFRVASTKFRVSFWPELVQKIWKYVISPHSVLIICD